MIRLSHDVLPPGLSVLARRGSDAELIVVVSTALPPDRQRAAVRVALRAARRADGRARLLPLPGIALLAASRIRLAGILRACRAHWAVTTGAAVTALAAVAAVVTFAVVPRGYQPAGAARGPGHSHLQGSAPRAGAPLPQPSRRSGAAGSQVRQGCSDTDQFRAAGHSRLVAEPEAVSKLRAVAVTVVAPPLAVAFAQPIADGKLQPLPVHSGHLGLPVT